MRTGESFGEVVLKHTLVYRVEQVFLIHKRSRSLLQHVATTVDVSEDADLIADRLIVMQQFVHDSFGVQVGDKLDCIEFGHMSVWIEQGPKAMIAALIRGSAPSDLRKILRDALDNIHLEQEEAIEGFEHGMPSEAFRPYLESCLQSQYG